MERLSLRRSWVLAGLSLLLAIPAAGQTYFTEVTGEAGISELSSRSAAWGDYDNDGWLDLFVTKNTFGGRGRVALWHNSGDGWFADLGRTILPDRTHQAGGGGAVFGDYDNDGDLDLFVPCGHFVPPAGNLLLRNDRGVLRDVALEVGLSHALGTDNAIWLDYDRDGFLDLYAANLHMGDPGLRNKLYRNRGDGTFAEVTEEAGLEVQLQECCGGSNGGMAAGDFNDDGWPDLYLGAWRSPNRLFLNDTQGHFRDVTTAEIGDPGQAHGVAVGDLDNDGDLDLFQTAGGGAAELLRSLFLLNLGGGQLLDATESIGVLGLGATNTSGTGLGDIDNDGDLDLLTADPATLYLNDGTGLLVDCSAQSGIDSVGTVLALGDYDLDGFLDVVGGTGSGFGWGTVPWGKLYHNNGNSNHYLRVELVGTRSNRSGIGARLIATSGDLKQMREILGGLGYQQDEMIAHFGLGLRTQVDSLHIRWPSGAVDVLTDIPADQKIRVIEGQAGYWTVQPMRMEGPDTLVVGWQGKAGLWVVPRRFEAQSQIRRVVADLSALGGGSEVVLQEQADGTYAADLPLRVEGVNGTREISVRIDQSTSLGPYWTRLSRQVAVFPAADLMIFADALAEAWTLSTQHTVKVLPEEKTVAQGQKALAVQTNGIWRVACQPPVAVGLVGYRALRLAVHPGDVSEGVIDVGVNGKKVNVVPGKEGQRVDLGVKQYQVVELPLELFSMQESLQGLSISGKATGTVYLDDIRLVAARPSSVPGTAVLESQTNTLPTAFSLAQNHPNPFNSDTVIRFSLPTRAAVRLALYNLAGQQVVTLVEGARDGGEYEVTWDGRSPEGGALASGVYLYHLQVGGQGMTRKLLLLR